MEKLLTVREVAEILHCHTKTVYRSPGLPSIDIPGVGIRFRLSELEELIAKNARCSLINNAAINPPKTNILLDLAKYDKIYLKSNKGGICGSMRGQKTRWNYGVGSVSVRKTKQGKERWYVDYAENGKRVREVVKNAQSRSDAILHLQQRVSDAFSSARGLERQKARVKYSEFADCYIRDYARSNKRSWKNDLSCLKANLLPEFGNAFLNEITPLLLEKYRTKRLESGISKSSINREMALMKKMYSLAIDWGFAVQNPVKKIKLFSEKDTLKERILTEDEEAMLLSTCAPHLKPILIVALHTGMRLGEILGLKWGQVDFRRLQLKVERTKSGLVRFIPINPALAETLGTLRAKNGGCDHIFDNAMTGKPLTTVKNAFQSACRRAGIIGLRFHDLRHTVASRLVERGVDLITVKELLGHSSVKITERYTHPNQALKKSAVNCLLNGQEEMSENPKSSSNRRQMDERVIKGRVVTSGYSIS